MDWKKFFVTAALINAVAMDNAAEAIANALIEDLNSNKLFAE